MQKKPSATISRLVFSGGNEFVLDPNEKIILVGPNNSGKSQSLREILAICQNGEKERPVIITELEIAKVGSTEEFHEFLEENADYVDGHYRYEDWTIPEGILRLWSDPYLRHGLSQGFIKKIAADDRLMICEQQDSIGPSEQKSKPQHILYDDEELMSKVSGLFKRAFGKDIMFDFRGGKRIPIHVGDIPKSEGTVDRVEGRGCKRLDVSA